MLTVKVFQMGGGYDLAILERVYTTPNGMRAAVRYNEEKTETVPWDYVIPAYSVDTETVEHPTNRWTW